MWFSLADWNGDLRAGKERKSLTADMTENGVLTGEDLALRWQPGDCPGPRV